MFRMKTNKNINKNEGRTEWLDSLRAFAICLVVFGHVAETGNNKVMDYLTKGIYLFHMPLFFVMSGITFELFTLKKNKDLKKVWIKRIVNLMVPVFCFVMIRIIFNGDRSIFPLYNAAWFLIHLSLIISIEIYREINREKKRVRGGVIIY